MKSVKKIFKLLCYVLVTVLIFGGDVLAATAPNKVTIQSDESNIWYDRTIGGDRRWSTVKKAISGSDTYYALCLDSSKIADKTTNGMTLKTQLTAQSTYSSGYQSKIKYILLKAYQLGLGNGESSHSFTIPNDSGKKYTVSDKDLYGITQSAVWNAAHGTKNDGYTNAFQSWIKDNKYDKIFEYLNNNTYNHSWIVLAGPSSSMTEDGDYLVSKDYTVNGNIPSMVPITATVSNGEMSVNGGTWTSSATSIKIGDKIKVRVAKPENGGVSATISVETSDYYTGGTAAFYQSDKGTDYQNMAIFIPETGKSSYSTTVTGNYETNYKLNVYKKDSDGNNIAGAKLTVYREDGTNKINIATVISDEDGVPVDISVAGRYCVQEIEAPSGYVLNNEPVCDDIDSTNTEISISVVNDKKIIKYRKVDADGNPIAGVQMVLIDYNDKLAEHEENRYVEMCAESDSSGYFTKACDPSYFGLTSAKYDASGEYDYPIDGKIYYIQEKFLDGYYNPDFDLKDNDHDFGIFDGELVTNNNYIEIDDSDTNTIVIKIVNDKYINISKTDLGSGEEIEGAHMILQKKVRDKFFESETGDKSILYIQVDEWDSEKTPHTFVGIIPGETYILSETVAPAGYLKLQTDIEFTMDANGNVEVLSKDQTLVKPKDNATNWLIVGNDLLSAPKTGVSVLNLFAIGGLMVFIGYEVIKIYRRKADI